MPLITVNPTVGTPGQIVDTRPWYSETCQYTSLQVSQVHTLNLNPVTITPYGNYTIEVAGSSSTMVYSPGVGSAILDFTSQLTQHINRFGYLWASITGTGLITLTARQPGVTYSVAMLQGLTQATLTLTQAASSPAPLTAGTLVFWDRPYSSTDPVGHRKITTLDVASGVAGFDLVRDCAGVVLRDPSNYSSLDTMPSNTVEVVRQGAIWVRNYGSVNVSRDTAIRVNNLAGTSLIPAGGFGLGTLMTNLPVQYDYPAVPGAMTRVRINLI